MQKIDCKKHMLQNKLQQVLGQLISRQLFPKRCEGHPHRLMDEALKCCDFAAKFELIKQGADAQASDMLRFRKRIYVIEDIDFSLDCEGILGANFD
jgi:hypothetical protein